MLYYSQYLSSCSERRRFRDIDAHAMEAVVYSKRPGRMSEDVYTPINTLEKCSELLRTVYWQ